MPRVLGAIPARFSSERFPGKPLAMIGKKPMIQWVYEAACRCSELEKVVVATDDERIRGVVADFGGEVLMTSDKHQSGTDRLAEVAEYYPEYDVLINIQGDEPGIDPALISGVAALKLRRPEWEMATAARPFKREEDPLDPNRVKVTISKAGRALYFSRSLIPFPRNRTDQEVHLHLGIYAYNRDFLLRFRTLPASGLERTESLEQLRAIENDYTIGVHLVEDSMPAVDTPQDLAEVKALFVRKGMITQG